MAGDYGHTRELGIVEHAILSHSALSLAPLPVLLEGTLIHYLEDSRAISNPRVFWNVQDAD